MRASEGVSSSLTVLHELVPHFVLKESELFIALEAGAFSGQIHIELLIDWLLYYVGDITAPRLLLTKSQRMDSSKFVT